MKPKIEIYLFRVSPTEENRSYIFPSEVESHLEKKVGEERLRSQAAYSFLIGKCRERGILPQFDFSNKPALKSGFRFSISHTDDCVAVAIGECEIGVDIEKKGRQISSRLFKSLSSEERKSCGSDSSLFLKFWVKKEAYLKMIGRGIRLRLDEVDTTSLKNCHVFEQEGLWIAVCSEDSFTESDVQLRWDPLSERKLKKA